MNTRMMLLHRHTLIARLEGLPQGYESIEYVGSGGNAYIDTGVMPYPDRTRLWINFSLDRVDGTQALLGSRVNAVAGDPYACNIFVQNGLRLDWIGSSQSVTSVNVGTKYEMDCHNNTVIFNGKTYQGSTKKSSARLSGAILLFNLNTGTSPYSQIANAKIYGCKIWDEDENLIRDFKPAMDSSGNYGLYDLVGKKMYKSANTQKLIGG